MKRPGVGVGVIVKKDGKVLVGKRMGKHAGDTWSIPGGHLELMETVEDCAKRETLEEARIKVDNVQRATYTEDHYETGKHYITIYVTAEYRSGEPEVREPDKMKDWQWVEWDELPRPLMLSMQNMLRTGFNPFE